MDHPRGTTIMVLGVLSITGMAVLGPFVWSMARRALQEADAAPHPTSNRSALETGLKLGRWGTYALIASAGILILAVLAVLVLDVVAPLDPP